MKIWLVRHAESSGQAADAPLTSLGAAQAKALVPVLQKLNIDTVFSSPYRRATATLAPFAAIAGLKIQKNKDFSERLLAPNNRSDWLDHIKLSFADPDYKLHGGESLSEAAQRIRRGINSIQSTSAKNIAIVSHGNTISSLLMQLNPTFCFSNWQEMRNPDLFYLKVSNGILQSYKRVDL